MNKTHTDCSFLFCSLFPVDGLRLGAEGRPGVRSNRQAPVLIGPKAPSEPPTNVAASTSQQTSPGIPAGKRIVGYLTTTLSAGQIDILLGIHKDREAQLRYDSSYMFLCNNPCLQCPWW